jgi:hypothetical protein
VRAGKHGSPRRFLTEERPSECCDRNRTDRGSLAFPAHARPFRRTLNTFAHQDCCAVDPDPPIRLILAAPIFCAPTNPLRVSANSKAICRLERLRAVYERLRLVWPTFTAVFRRRKIRPHSLRLPSSVTNESWLLASIDNISVRNVWHLFMIDLLANGKVPNVPIDTEPRQPVLFGID